MLPVMIEAPIEAALKSVQLGKCIRETCREVGSRFVIQSVGLDQPGTCCGIPECPSQVPDGLGVIVRGLAAGGVAACNPQVPGVGCYS
jgi:hypothetical protein